MELLAERLADAQTKLESAGKDNFRFEQGRVAELREMLELEQAAVAVIDAERSMKVRPPSID
tara:strand:+ start:279 stop:464 length:186 start_codon:yes stop_codon:yes gene_type:complete